jgi:Domain of Unknown Function (DUF1080)
MKLSHVIAVIGFVVVSLAFGAGAGLSGGQVIADGQNHGDPPYLLESGWKPLLDGKTLSGWKLQTPERGGWGSTSGVFWGGPDNPKLLKGISSPGDRILNTMTDLKPVPSNIFTAETFGDTELYLEFMVSEGSNSGVYMQGLYEVQVYDSFGKTPASPTAICGAIYNYVPVNNTYVGGVAPRVRAERPIGQWQSYRIWFQAPRFDAAGKKTANAKFLRVLHNGVLIHENVEREGPTQAAMKIPEAAANPLMLQGDHTQIAYRNIYIRPLRLVSK